MVDCRGGAGVLSGAAGKQLGHLSRYEQEEISSWQNLKMDFVSIFKAACFEFTASLGKPRN